MACPSGHQHTHYGTPTKHEKEGHLAPPCSIAFYESLTSEPINEFESKAPDGSCSPMLDSITAIGPDDAVASVSSAVLTRTPLCPYITVTGSDGTRVYMKFQQTEYGSDSLLPKLSASTHLLPVSSSPLRSSVQEEQVIEQSNCLLQSTRSTMDSVSESVLANSDAVAIEGYGAANASILWVDKYAPRHYTHLLSDDGINRTLLSWIKLWDKAVFGHSSLSTCSAGNAGRRRDKGGCSNGSGEVACGGMRVADGVHTWRKERREFGDLVSFAVEEALDESRRPQLKLALLCGAPGLGKTTLAHIVAQHAGYRVVEINASDDRSADIFGQKLEATTQMQTVLTPDCRPTCLVIDEIDGAPTAAINVLIDVVKRKRSGKHKRLKVLSRPVICICNDQYAPPLRQLKQYALILVFPPTLASRLAYRLQQVYELRRVVERMDSQIKEIYHMVRKMSRERGTAQKTLQEDKYMYNGHNLLKVHAKDAGSYTRALLDIFEEQLGRCLPLNPTKQLLDQERVHMLLDTPCETRYWRIVTATAQSFNIADTKEVVNYKCIDPSHQWNIPVIHQENMISSMSTLMALCGKANNDIRACLNTLQFVSRQQRELTAPVVLSASVGQKDAQMSLFSLWKEIFQLPSAKRHPVGCSVRSKGQAPNGGHEISTATTWFYHMLSAASATGEYEKVCHGLFENYLNIRFKDPNLEAVCVGLEWVLFRDTLQQHISQTQNYVLYSYLPFLSLAFHFLFASPSKPYIRYPHTNFEMLQKKKQTEHLLSSIMLEVPAHMHLMLTSVQLATEMLALILEIITPMFRPVSTQLYTAREKQQLADLVDTMISYGLTFKQEKGPDGQYTYVIDPCLEEVCQFSGQAQRKKLSYSVKQLIAREIEVEKMRRVEKMMTGHMGVSPVRPDNMKSNESANGTLVKKPAVKVLEPVKYKPALDIFGQKVKPGAKSAAGVMTASHTQHSLWFRFNEGFSNAVRRPVHVQDLL